MKPKDNETFEQWLIRARDYELDRALRNLAQGQDPNIVAEELANKLLSKALHPIIKSLQKTSIDK